MSPVGVLFVFALLLVPMVGAAAHGSRAGATRGRSAAITHAGHPFAARIHEPRSVFPVPVDPWKSWPPRAKARRVPHPPAVPFGGVPLFSSALVVPDGSYAPSFLTMAPPGSADAYAMPPPVPAPPAAAPAPQPPPLPGLIEYADGWYQLRGDGVAEPYRWVWIPKPPPASPPVSAAPPSASTPRTERPVAEKPSVAYHWTDEGGVTTWTNRLDRVPKRYRDRAAESAQPD